MSLLETVEVVRLGVGTEHEPQTVVECPQGVRDTWVVMCFSTPFWFRGAGQTVAAGLPGDCVIHAPSEPHAHGAAAGSAAGFRNDWIHLRGPGVTETLAECGLETSVRLSTRNSHTMTPYLQRIQRELYRRDVQWERMAGLEVEAMLVGIARSRCAAGSEAEARLERAMRERMTDVRVHVHQTLRRPWTVAEMAAEACLSPSRFHSLYQQFFAVSPMDDLIQRRILYAQWLLSTTGIPVAEAARRAGFSSPYYFSRAFRQRTGQSPSGFARERP